MTVGRIAGACAPQEDLGLVRELTGRRKDRPYGYAPYLAILSEGTEPL